jgi:hypothetical protein
MEYTTTLAAETGNNTSSPKGGNVSNVSIKELLPNTTLFAHVIPWHTNPPNASHALDPSGYNSEDLYQCIAQVKDIKRRGFDGVWVTWQGMLEDFKQRATRRLLDACEAEGLKFVIALDQTAVRSYMQRNPSADINIVIAQMYLYALDKYSSSSAYFTLNTRPVLSEFGLETLTGVDMNKVYSGLGRPVSFIYRNSGGLSRPQSAGAYAWLDDGLAYLDWFYKQVKILAVPGQTVFGSIFPGFDNSLAQWAVKNGGTEKDKIIDRRQGQLWLDTIQKFKDAGVTYGQAATWNDHEEGTGIEQGIDGGVSITLSPDYTYKKSGLVHHVDMYVSDDGKRLAPFDIGLPVGTYQVYAKAVGMPSVLNAMSNPVPLVVKDPEAEIAASLLKAVREATRLA